MQEPATEAAPAKNRGSQRQVFRILSAMSDGMSAAALTEVLAAGMAEGAEDQSRCRSCHSQTTTMTMSWSRSRSGGGLQSDCRTRNAGLEIPAASAVSAGRSTRRVRKAAAGCKFAAVLGAVPDQRAAVTTPTTRTTHDRHIAVGGTALPEKHHSMPMSRALAL